MSFDIPSFFFFLNDTAPPEFYPLSLPDALPILVEDFRRAFDPPPPPVFPDVEVVNEQDSARNILERWLTTPFDYLASDLEWTPDNRITCAGDRKSTRLNSSHSQISYAVFCLKKK